MPLLPGVAAYDALSQDSNPVSIVTSGLGRVAQTPFFASGKWRMVNRYTSWWSLRRVRLSISKILKSTATPAAQS